jgi:hypothetical protein
MAETPSIRDAVQRSENERKNSFFNYESPALTAELQAHHAPMREHPTFNVQPLSGDEFFAEISDCPPPLLTLLPNGCGFGIGA